MGIAPATGGGLLEEEPMSRTKTEAAVTAPTRTHAREVVREPAEVAAEVVTVLAKMTYTERVLAYRSGAFTAHELAVAAAWFPDHTPVLNGELEWIGISLADNE
ncbi:MAG: hypothetical protein JWO14_2207 [Solirubrobacterales bacterium]|nr:hypothetical protein [Solirubrobacterales bacterium]